MYFNLAAGIVFMLFIFHFVVNCRKLNLITKSLRWKYSYLECYAIILIEIFRYRKHVYENSEKILFYYSSTM